MVQENRRLKELLESHGIIYNPDDKEPVYGHGRRQHVPQTATPPPTNYDELGISFVLAYEFHPNSFVTPTPLSPRLID